LPCHVGLNHANPKEYDTNLVMIEGNQELLICDHKFKAHCLMLCRGRLLDLANQAFLYAFPFLDTHLRTLVKNLAKGAWRQYTDEKFQQCASDRASKRNKRSEIYGNKA
jgi:hypothetical protein